MRQPLQWLLVIPVAWAGVLIGAFLIGRPLRNSGLAEINRDSAVLRVVDAAILIGILLALFAWHSALAANLIAGVGGLVSGALKGMAN